jgi:sporulation protein YabP
MNDSVTQATNTTATQNRGHSLVAVDRREITVKGVSEVISFDETNVRLVTVCGILNLEGEGLRIHVLNTKDGMVAVTGKLDGVLYEEEQTAATKSDDRPKSRARRLFG